ncbi:unnamed protein product [Adineta steineri]|uniref:BED-type domain-containing protein n=1 Tax=Adineta steineri TaxID=433720 RepID=A0A819RQK5_9BILA|nr:unnamed protein product [Adineta steineri]CAF1407257.1 unnamed protein product [Adineta steineri]CAF4050020.1 unnamed protein product [Adineta steineri]CAF4130692.1 unnamed protein product [Adineta steineri]
MPSTTISKSNAKTKRKIPTKSKYQAQHLDDMLNEEVVTRTTQTRSQSIPSSSTSNSTNTTTATTNINEIQVEDLSTDNIPEPDEHITMKSEVWDYATKMPNGKAKCNKCKKDYSCKDHNTSSLRRHLNRCLNTSKFSSNENKTSTKKIDNERKKKLNELVYQCVIQDGRNFGDLRKPGMIRLLNEIVPGYTPPTRRTVQRQLTRYYYDHTKMLVTELKTINALAVTTDLWSDKNLNSYMCLTGHYMNANSKLDSKVLSFTVFEERHTGEQISYTIKKELKRLQVYDKTNTITCDGASNMKKSFKKLKPKRLQCLGHKLHLTVCNALCLWVKEPEVTDSSNNSEEHDTSAKDARTTANSSNNIREFDDVHNDTTDETLDMGPEPMEEEDLSNDNDEGEDSLDDEELSGDEDSNGSNNSADMVNAVNDNWEEDVVEDYTSIISNEQLLEFELNGQEWAILESVKQVLNSFFEATKLVSGKKYSTIGLGFFAIASLKQHLEERSNNNEVDRLKDLLLDQLTKYFEYDIEQYELLKRYAFYDPIGFGVLDRKERSTIECEIRALHKDYTTSLSNSNSLNVGLTQTTAQKPKVNLLQGFLASVNQHQPRIIKKDAALSIANELALYRSLAITEFNEITDVNNPKPHDPFAFWNLHSNKLKFLSSLARKNLIIPSTSVPSESTFSVAAYLGRKERNRLTSENLCMLVFLKDKINLEMENNH